MEERVDHRGKYKPDDITEQLIVDIQTEVTRILERWGHDVDEINRGRKSIRHLVRELIYDDVYLRRIDGVTERVARSAKGFVRVGKSNLISELGRYDLSSGEQIRGPSHKGLSETCHYGEPEQTTFQRGLREEWELERSLEQIVLLFDSGRPLRDIRDDLFFLMTVCGISPDELSWKPRRRPSTAYHGFESHTFESVFVLHEPTWPFANDPHKVVDNGVKIFVKCSTFLTAPPEWMAILGQTGATL